MTEEKLKDLIAQATVERSHFYVKSVCEEALQELSTLRQALEIAESSLKQTWPGEYGLAVNGSNQEALTKIRELRGK